MVYLVDVRRIGGDSLVTLMGEMRTWLEHARIEPAEFDHSSNGIGTVIRAGFHDMQAAVAFAEAFGGRLIGDDPGSAILWQSRASISRGSKRG